MFPLSLALQAHADPLPPDEAEQAQRLRLLSQIAEGSDDPEEVATAKCAIAVITGTDAPSEDCRKRLGLGNGRLTRAARVRRVKRIVNGVPTWGYPAVGSLIGGLSAASATQLCTGTMIASDKFLTAAHCVEGNAGNDSYFVYLQQAGIYKVSDVKWPDDYPAKGDEADIAVLTLACSVPGIRPQPLNEHVENIPYGYNGTIIGFGRTGGSKSGGKKEDYGIKRVGFVKTDQCPGSKDGAKHVCWTFNSTVNSSNTCSADSGGPMIDGLGVPLILGVTTAGMRNVDCGLNDRSWDLSVYPWMDWIKEQIDQQRNNADCPTQISGEKKTTISELQRLGPEKSILTLDIDTRPNVKALTVAMNGEDDRFGANDFNLAVIDPDTDDGDKLVCEEDGPGQFAVCEIQNPRPGPWRVEVYRNFGEGLVQVTVTETR